LKACSKLKRTSLVSLLIILASTVLLLGQPKLINGTFGFAVSLIE